MKRARCESSDNLTAAEKRQVVTTAIKAIETLFPANPDAEKLRPTIDLIASIHEVLRNGDESLDLSTLQSLNRFLAAFAEAWGPGDSSEKLEALNSCHELAARILRGLANHPDHFYSTRIQGLLMERLGLDAGQIRIPFNHTPAMGWMAQGAFHLLLENQALTDEERKQGVRNFCSSLMGYVAAHFETALNLTLDNLKGETDTDRASELFSAVVAVLDKEWNPDLGQHAVEQLVQASLEKARDKI